MKACQQFVVVTPERGLPCHVSPNSRVSARLAAITESATLAVDAKAKALQAEGEAVIGFGAGEPDFPTPEHIVEAAIAACRDPRNHRYTPAGGLPELREAIAVKTKRDSGYDCTAAQVLVTNGGKHAVFTAFAALCDPGDEVILPAPYWTTYPEAIALAGGVPKVVETTEETGFQVTVDQLEAAWTPRTKVLLFVSPDNPSGAVYPPEQVAAIGRWAVERGVWVITDEIYEHLTYGPHEFASMPTLVPDLADQCVIVNGVAKTYAMTGWRVGWMIAPPDVAKAGVNFQSHATSNVANVSQRAALAAVSGDLEAVAMMRSGVRAAGPHDALDALGHPGRHVHRAAGRVLLLPPRRRAVRARPRRAHVPLQPRARRPRPVGGQGGVRPRRGVRRPRLRPLLLRPRRRRPRRGHPPLRRPRLLTIRGFRRAGGFRAPRPGRKTSGAGRQVHHTSKLAASPVTTTSTAHSATCSIAPRTSPVIPPIARQAKNATTAAAGDGGGGERARPPAGGEGGDADGDEARRPQPVGVVTERA